MTGWPYALLCVVGPGAWGVLMYFVFNAIDRKRKLAAQPTRPPVDYSI